MVLLITVVLCKPTNCQGQILIEKLLINTYV